MRTFSLLFSVLVMAACGGSGSPKPDAADPASVPFGTTAIVVVVNPTVNDANNHTVPAPGTARAGVTLTTDDHVTATTGADGIAVLAPVMAGTRTITISGAGVAGSVPVMIGPGELREVAISATSSAQVMLDIDYKTDQAVMVDASMTNAQVNSVLAVSDRNVFFTGGTYIGDLDFSGSRVTLFGEGVLGGRVEIQGNVTVSGSNSRIRGTSITGNLTIPASGVGLSFSRVDGTLDSQGSDGYLLQNAFCGTSTITGSGTTALGNAGAAPITPCM